MKIVIAGGTGLLGRVLTRKFRRDGHSVLVLSRNVESPGVLWDGKTLGGWTEIVDGADVLVNLAGRHVNTRYDAKTRAEIMSSRVDSTRVLGQAVARAANPPKVWLQASTATIYSHRFDAPNDEYTGILGGFEPDAPKEWHFSTDVARAWEQAIDEADTPHTRRVKMRMAVVMTLGRGSAFELMLRHVRLGFGRMGDGKQYISWLHEEDFTRAVDWLIEHDIEGPVNLASPHPLPNGEFMHVLHQAWGMPLSIPSVRPILDVGAFLMRTELELVLKSRRVVPARLLEHGFSFNYSRWQDAARDLVAQVRGEKACGTQPSPVW